MITVAYSTKTLGKGIVLEESTGEHVSSDDLDSLFTFLLEPYEDKIKVCWNLDATVALFLRLMSIKDKEKLHKTKRCVIAPFNVFYVPGKVFSVGHIPSRQKANLYGIDQFYPEVISVKGVEETKALGDGLLHELKRMGFEPTKLTSPIAIYDECVMRQMDLPGITDIPLEALEFAYRCSGRLWIESHQLGHWDMVYDYDMTSAFPNVAKHLIDPRQHEWLHSTDYQEKAIYGYVRCNVTIRKDVMISPIMRETEDGLISPIGTWEEYLTKGELDFITKHSIGKWEIIDGWWLMPKGDMSKPLYYAVEKLLRYKQGSALQALLAKRMSTGLYGKFGEEHSEEFGQHFMPVWFAEISTQARLQVGEFLYAHGIGETLIHIGVDGVMVSKEISEPLGANWHLVYSGEALVVSSGEVYTELTRPKGLKLLDIKGMINKNPKASYYEKKIKRRLTLGDSLAKWKIGDIGKEFDFSVSMSLINKEHDRVFKKLPRSGKQLLGNTYGSEPMVVW